MHATEIARDDRTAEVLADLVRGELAAVETYEQALEKIDGFPDGTRLREIHAEHVYAVNALRGRLGQYTTDLPKSSGAWGAFAKAVEGVAKLFGNTAALRALHEGEEHGIKEYERAMEKEWLDTEVKSLIVSELLPKCRSHIFALERVIERQ
ncbi:MAG TPA: DUF2383 domain-containing protein [Nannocystaceae bacterium]|nr:DUF2383 domain-containing protein [Nannocystaceae bacterium]